MAVVFCKVVSATQETRESGTVVWVLVHKCGKVERRRAQKRGRSLPAPTKVTCCFSAQS